jgi:hypothetical protein
VGCKAKLVVPHVVQVKRDLLKCLIYVSGGHGI